LRCTNIEVHTDAEVATRTDAHVGIDRQARAIIDPYTGAEFKLRTVDKLMWISRPIAKEPTSDKIPSPPMRLLSSHVADETSKRRSSRWLIFHRS